MSQKLHNQSYTNIFQTYIGKTAKTNRISIVVIICISGLCWESLRVFIRICLIKS